VSIGADLAEARRQAHLTVTQVSQRTCIREMIIRSIESDDYAVCGGDFYARGHIRAIAKVVGADSGPLIGEYDAAHSPAVVPAAGPAEPAAPAGPSRPAGPVSPGRPAGPGGPDPPGGRHRLAWAIALALVLVAALGFVAYRVIPGSGHRPPAAPAAGVHRPVHHHRQASPAAAPAPGPYAHRVAVRLRAIEDCWVEFTTPGGGLLSDSIVVAGTSKGWTFRHPVDMTLGNPGGIRLTLDGKHPLAPGPASPVTFRLGLDGKISR
jgi:Helix-turn-helix domain/Domain of unknown function (DUF4115)